MDKAARPSVEEHRIQANTQKSQGEITLLRMPRLGRHGMVRHRLVMMAGTLRETPFST